MARATRANLGMIAAGVAFFGFLSIFPAFAFVIAVWSFAADPAIIREELDLLADFLPPDALSLLSGQVEALLGANSSDLGWATLLSLLIAFWSARAGVAGMISGLNAVHHHPERNGVHSVLLALALTLVLVLIALAALLVAVVVPLLLNVLPLGSFTALVLEIANALLALGLLVLGLALTYRFGPNRPSHVRANLFTRGLLVAVVLWLVVSRGFVIYLANFNSYNQVYGSIGAVVILMMWLYLSAYAVLLGAAVDAERAQVPEEGLPPDPDQ
ncbi:MAG: YihY/virulence factor BrkB family protein [Gemmobacter sp.]|nr:YihY/virulence factor BrkB family protein [Gemmobacter sp.]